LLVHRSGIWRELLSVDVETFLVFRERHRESRRRFFFRREVECFEFSLSKRFATLAGKSVADRGMISANIIAGFGSPSGPVSTQCETRCRGVPAAGPVTMLPACPPAAKGMINSARSMIRIVHGDGHPIHCNDLKRLPFELKVEITICGSIHKTQNWRSPGAISIGGLTAPFSVKISSVASDSAPQSSELS